jgi:hypothetical protein
MMPLPGSAAASLGKQEAFHDKPVYVTTLLKSIATQSERGAQRPGSKEEETRPSVLAMEAGSL